MSAAELKTIDGLLQQGEGVLGGCAGEDALRVAGWAEGGGCADREGGSEWVDRRWRSTNVLHELRVKRVQFNDALVQALGLRVEARMVAQGEACSEAVTPGCVAHVATKVVNGGRDDGGGDVGLCFADAGKSRCGKERTCGSGRPQRLQPGKTLDSFYEFGWRSGSVAIHGGASDAKRDPTTRPYFSKKNSEQAYYDVNDAALQAGSADTAGGVLGEGDV